MSVVGQTIDRLIHFLVLSKRKFYICHSLSMFVCCGRSPLGAICTCIKQCKEWRGAEKQKATTDSRMTGVSPRCLLTQTQGERGNQCEWNGERRGKKLWGKCVLARSLKASGKLFPLTFSHFRGQLMLVSERESTLITRLYCVNVSSKM